MAANGPCGTMYRLKNVYNFSENVPLPDCMYKMKNIYSCIHDDKKMPQQQEESGGSGGDVYRQLERRQEEILEQLSHLHAQVSLIKGNLQIGQKKQTTAPPAAALKPCPQTKMQMADGPFQDVVVSADPSDPPLSLWVLRSLLRGESSSERGVHLCTHTHSSVVGHLPNFVLKLASLSGSDPPLSGPRSQQRLILTLIWKKIAEPELMVNPLLQTAIRGEANIARYLNGFLATRGAVGPEEATEVDCWLDRTTLMYMNGKDQREKLLQTMDAQLGRTRYLVGDCLTVADVVAWSALLKSKNSSLPSNVGRWWKTLCSQPTFHPTATLLGVH